MDVLEERSMAESVARSAEMDAEYTSIPVLERK
jgi:hypothetical protein